MSHAGPVPAGRTGQYLREAAGVVPPTVEPMVPQQLVVCSLQPGDKGGGGGGGDMSKCCLHKIKRKTSTQKFLSYTRV